MATWHTPQMIELVRGRADEATLLACKASLAGTGPSAQESGCFNLAAPTGGPCGPSSTGISLNAIVCAQCSSVATS